RVAVSPALPIGRRALDHRFRLVFFLDLEDFGFLELVDKLVDDTRFLLIRRIREIKSADFQGIDHWAPGRGRGLRTSLRRALLGQGRPRLCACGGWISPSLRK